MDGLTTFAAKYLIIVPLLAVIYIYIQLKTTERKRFLILLVATGLLSLVVAKIAAHLYWHPRPFISDGVKPLFTSSRDNGFPSDHTLLAAFLAFVSLSYSKKIGIGLLVVAVLVGWARVAAGVHHAVDVLGSFIITALAYLLARYLMRTYAKPLTHKQPN
jgi:undecaprenyl-diphosphatase